MNKCAVSIKVKRIIKEIRGIFNLLTLSNVELLDLKSLHTFWNEDDLAVRLNLQLRFQFFCGTFFFRERKKRKSHQHQLLREQKSLLGETKFPANYCPSLSLSLSLSRVRCSIPLCS